MGNMNGFPDAELSLQDLDQLPAFTVGQLGQSLDGRIATPSGDSHYINGEVARRHLHRLRALVDAVVIGAGTAISDQPQLTVRLAEGENPVRVLLDPNARVPQTGPLFDTGPALLWVIGENTPPPESLPAHVELVRMETGDRGFSPHEVIEALNQRGLKRLLIEGGAITVSRFVDANALDRLHLLIAPLLIGSGPSGITLPEIERLADARRPPMRCYRLGDELLVDVELKAGRRKR